jgi:hypothetical protein
MEDAEEEDSPALASPAAKKRRHGQKESDEEEVQRAFALAKRPKLRPTTPARQLRNLRQCRLDRSKCGWGRCEV